MSKCPFWSSKRQKIDCYKECPMLLNENGQHEDEDQCIFKGCSFSSDLSFKDIIKEDYNFLNLSSGNENEKKEINL